MAMARTSWCALSLASTGRAAAIEVLRWDGAAFRSILRTETEAIDRGTWAGDTDGERR